MSEKARAILKAYFNTGDKPSEAEFANLIDSMSNFSDDFANRYIKKTLSSAQLLSSFSSPIEIVAAPGADKIAFGTFMIAKTNYGSIPYATHINMRLLWNGVTASFDDSVTISRAEDYIQILEFYNSIATPKGNAVNKNLVLKTTTGNPTAGDGTMDIYLWYRILTL